MRTRHAYIDAWQCLVRRHVPEHLRRSLEGLGMRMYLRATGNARYGGVALLTFVGIRPEVVDLLAPYDARPTYAEMALDLRTESDADAWALRSYLRTRLWRPYHRATDPTFNRDEWEYD